MEKHNYWLAALLALAISASVAPSLAEEANDANPLMSAPNFILIPGALTGVGTKGSTGYWRLCDPPSIGLNEWRTQWVEGVIKPSDHQRTLLNALMIASASAKEIIAAACPREKAPTSTAQLAMMEKRVLGLLNALKILRPAYENFYAALDGRQRSAVEALGPGRRGWRL